jgi:hypothetical protein
MIFNFKTTNLNLLDDFKNNIVYTNIKYDFLLGLKSMLNICYCCMIEKYSIWNGDKIYTNNKITDTFDTVKIRYKDGVHLAYFPDDFIYLGETNSHFWIVYISKFDEDSFMCKIQKSKYTYKQVVSEIQHYITIQRNNTDNLITGNYLDMPVKLPKKTEVQDF